MPISEPSSSHGKRVVGVIAEYNPFHLGHLHHLQYTKEQLKADYLVVCISTCFIQRGEPALLSVKDRTAMALSCGADAIIALPALWSLREAEGFALGGVSLLSSLGCDYLSFGAEDADLDMLWQVASLLESPSDTFSDLLREHLARGLSFPRAQAEAMRALYPKAGSVLSSPNNTLAIAYLRQILRTDAAIQPFAVKRTSSYLSSQLTAHTLPSASAVRSAVLQGNWPAVQHALPESCLTILRSAALEGRILRPDALDTAVLFSLRSLSPARLSALPDQDGGLPDRLLLAAKDACSLEDLVRRTATRRYTVARVRRLIWQSVLGWDKKTLRRDSPEGALLLGVRQDASELLSILGSSRIPLLTRAQQLQGETWEKEALAWDLWALGCRKGTGSLYRNGIVRI
ncbi:MAG: nucleotidyltransferase family protein [Clostridia bacterium]|nr:nucleotidyltransferase family protein [Clostridia bacterium]MBR1686227.1 nucleotidyltransferase family protein [Clostridia bacterium]MBR2288164.1 nucleotidyltransferase family protein [Clostridia bacterium]